MTSLEFTFTVDLTFDVDLDTESKLLFWLCSEFPGEFFELLDDPDDDDDDGDATLNVFCDP